MRVECERSSDGVELSHVRWGASGAIRGQVVCVHGIRSHAGWYEGSCQYFAEQGYETFFMDRRGSGLNRVRGGRRVTASLLMNDVSCFLERRRGEHPELPLHLVGISWGGKLAAATLLGEPGLADSLTLVTPGIFAKRDIGTKEKFQVLLYHWVSPGRMMRIPLNEPELFTANPERIAYIREDALSLTECPVGLMWASFILDRRVQPSGAKLTVPVFMMLAEHDEIVDNERLERYQAELGCMSKQMKVYAGAHHTLEFESDPGSIFRDMTNWFSRFDRKTP